MARFSSLRVRFAGSVFLAVAAACAIMYFTVSDPPWAGFVVGLAALGGAWFGGERFILHQIRALSKSAREWARGNFSSRTGLKAGGELGELAQAFDSMAAKLELRALEQEQAEKTLLNRSFQQTVVSALGQFALVTNELAALVNQAAILVTQTIEVEYGHVLELQPDGITLALRAGAGWDPGEVGRLTVPAEAGSQMRFALQAGEPVVTQNLSEETRFEPSPWLSRHGVVSGVMVTIRGPSRAFGLLGAHTTHRRRFTEDEVHFLLAVGTILAMGVERNRAQGQLKKLATFAQLYPNPALELSEDGAITYFNDAAARLATALEMPNPAGLLPADILSRVKDCLALREEASRFETQIQSRTLSWSLHPVLDSPLVHCYVEDITERLSLEAQLRQSQKMESVGQLAAGVAHDFNNMLTVIQGHSGLLLARPDLPQTLHDPAQAIYYAAERAASLTRQLLMFSRKNVMQTKLLDLREVVTHMSKMLQRLLGETVSLVFQPPPALPQIRGDVGMIEQVIMNLAVNARDAMPKGGTLTINTEALEIEEAYLHAIPEARAGLCACLCIADTGCGMDPATLARIFEPFFTTKEVGKGTGLGLATVYGIVKQHDGWIDVKSHPGAGTTFRVYFPACAPSVEAEPQSLPPAPRVAGGNETILIVEDEPVLRELAHTILDDCGYRVLEATSGREALQVWNQHADAIDLVVTDMVMPEGVSGMELAQQLVTFNPKLKIVFASGYSMDDLDTDFVQQGRAAFLQKPYTHVTLAKAVRDCLDQNPGGDTTQAA